MNKLAALFYLVVLTACVPLKQYTQAMLDLESAQKEKEELLAENDRLTSKNTELTGAHERIRVLAESLVADTLRLARHLHSLSEELAEARTQNNLLIEKLKSTVQVSVESELMAYLQKLQNDLQQREDALYLAEKDGITKRKALEQAIAELELAKGKLTAQNARLVELERIINEKEGAMNILRQTISEALTGFGPDELSINLRNGKVYVAMDEKLLFLSGRYEVNAQGISVLKKLCSVLEQKPDIQSEVEGHTDHIPYKSGILLDNWDLSVKRATSVVRIIIQNSTIEPSRITASGRSQYVPVAKGDDSLSRQKNRRIEIILAPAIDKLLEIVEGK